MTDRSNDTPGDDAPDSMAPDSDADASDAGGSAAANEAAGDLSDAQLAAANEAAEAEVDEADAGGDTIDESEEIDEDLDEAESDDDEDEDEAAAAGAAGGAAPRPGARPGARARAEEAARARASRTTKDRAPTRTTFAVDPALRIKDPASQAFVALIPYMVVVSAVLPSYERHTFADSIIHRFDLTGDSAAAIEHVFAPPKAVEETLARDPWSGTHLVVDSIDTWTLRLDARRPAGA